MNSATRDILSFWFGSWPYDEATAQKQAPIWFQASDTLDAKIKTQFQPLVESALNHAFQCDTLEDQLACIILLDQFTRNIYRGQAKAFSGDAQSLKLCLDLIKQEEHTRLPLHVAVFACMPLQHSEDPDVQVTSIETFTQIAQAHPDKASGFLDFAHQHKAIIDQFSRYPHRNEAMKRASTPEEQAYLDGDGARFGQ